MAERLPTDFGRSLREARERRGLSLRQIANSTKIPMSALEALERNDLSRLPGGIFSRAFVRAYAVEVGLDPDATLQEFNARFPNGSVSSGYPASTGQAEDHQAVDSERRTATTLVGLVAVSVPIAAVMIYFGASGRSVEAPAAGRPTRGGGRAGFGAGAAGANVRVAGGADRVPERNRTGSAGNTGAAGDRRPGRSTAGFAVGAPGVLGIGYGRRR